MHRSPHHSAGRVSLLKPRGWCRCWTKPNIGVGQYWPWPIHTKPCDASRFQGSSGSLLCPSLPASTQNHIMYIMYCSCLWTKSKLCCPGGVLMPFALSINPKEDASCHLLGISSIALSLASKSYTPALCGAGICWYSPSFMYSVYQRSELARCPRPPSLLVGCSCCRSCKSW